MKYNDRFIMKKFLLALVVLVSVMTVQAQSICATWRSMQPVVISDDDGSYSAQNVTYTFYEDGTYSFVDELTQSTQPAQTMALEIATNIELKGTYTYSGSQVVLTPDINTYNTELINVSMNGHVIEDPTLKAQIIEMLNSEEFKSQFAVVQTNDVTVGDAMLEMKVGDQMINFVRFATIRN